MSPVSKSSRRYSVALAGVLLYVVLDIVVQSLPPHYSPLSQAESDLAVGPYGYIMTVNFLNRGILSLEFLFALLGSLSLKGADLSKFRTAKYLFGTWAVGAILLAVFPTDVPATPISWHGAIHLVVAILAFLGGAFGVLSFSLNMTGTAALERLRHVALPIGVLSVVLCLVDLLDGFITRRIDARFGGLFERLFLGSVLLWIVVVSVYMLRHREDLTSGSSA